MNLNATVEVLAAMPGHRHTLGKDKQPTCGCPPINYAKVEAELASRILGYRVSRDDDADSGNASSSSSTASSE